MKFITSTLLASLVFLSNLVQAQGDGEVTTRFSLYIIPGAPSATTKDLFYMVGDKRVDISAKPGTQSIAYPYQGGGTIRIYRGAQPDPAAEGEAVVKPKAILTANIPAGKRYGILVASPKEGEFITQPYWFDGRESGEAVYIRNASKHPLATKFLEPKNKEKRPNAKGATLIKPGAVRAVSTRTQRPDRGNYRIARMHLYALKKDSKGKSTPLHIKRKNLAIKEGEGAAVLLYEQGRYNYRTVVLNAKGIMHMGAIEALNKQLGIRPKKKRTESGSAEGELEAPENG